jgi:hypothetical protein
MQFLKIVICHFLILISPELLAQESIDKVKSINGLKLGSTLASLQSELQLITGKETVYQNNPFLAESLKRNLEAGIKEGIYQGHPLRIINGVEAHDLRLIYLSGLLYKCRWTISKRDLPNMEGGFKDFIIFFNKKFGPPTEKIFNDAFIWEGDINKLTISYLDGSIQIEWKDNIIEKKAVQLTLD